MEEREKRYFHEETFLSLSKLLDEDKLAHALIIAGSEGSGQLELAIRLATYIVSTKVQNANEDRKQASRNRAEKFIHPDVHFSFPFIGNTIANDFLEEWRKALQEDIHMNITEWMSRLGAENKQANINAKECHSIIQKLGMKSFESEYKVLLMWLPEYLGKEGNRLLKLIEEPPENTVFILVTENLDAILNTILSRCQLVKLQSPTDEMIAEKLISEETIPREQAEKISFLVSGNYRLALEMTHEANIDFSQKLFEWLRTCYKLNQEETVNWCESFAKWNKEQQKYFIRYALQFFRSFLMLDVVEKDNLRFRPEEIDVATKLSRFIDLDAVETIEELLDNSFMMIERNANVKMLFMRNSIRIHGVFHPQRKVLA